MRNKRNFIPKSAPIQPDRYDLIFNGWCAVFETPTEEYHMQMIPDYFSDGCIESKGIELLKRGETCRNYVWHETFKTIKSAVETLTKIIERGKL